jgi:hypothetical protein
MRSFAVVVALVAGVSNAAPSLGQAQAELKALKYGEAAKTLKSLSQAEGFSQAEVIQYFTLLGQVRGALNDGEGARDAFMRALSLDPELKLQGKAAPRVTTPFFEAKGRVKDQGRLEVKVASKSEVEGGWALVLAASADPLAMATDVIISIDEDGVARSVTVPFSKVGALSVKGRKVRVGWSVLGAHGWVLQQSAPLELERAAVVVKPVEPVAKPAAAVVAKPEVVEPPSKVPGIVVLSSGVAVAAVGGVFIGLAHGTAAQAQQAQDVPTLQTLIDTGRSQQTVGFVALGVGGAVAVAGAVLLAVESKAPAAVAFAPVPGGGVAVLSGRF